MTVSELIEKLKRFPESTPVVIFDIDDSGRHWYYSPETLRHDIMMRVISEEESLERAGRYLKKRTHPDQYEPDKMSPETVVAVLA